MMNSGSMTPSYPALDPERLAALRAMAMPDLPDLAQEVAHLFINLAPERRQVLEQAASESRAADLVAAAHHLKGSRGNVGAMDLCGLCGEDERAAHGGQVDQELVSALMLELERVLAALVDEFGPPSDS